MATVAAQLQPWSWQRHAPRTTSSAGTTTAGTRPAASRVTSALPGTGSRAAEAAALRELEGALPAGAAPLPVGRGRWLPCVTPLISPEPAGEAPTDPTCIRLAPGTAEGEGSCAAECDVAAGLPVREKRRLQSPAWGRSRGAPAVGGLGAPPSLAMTRLMIHCVGDNHCVQYDVFVNQWLLYANVWGGTHP